MNFTHDKKIIDFYVKKCSEDDSAESKFALQYLALTTLKYRTSCLLDVLESYDVKVS